ncbi:MAG: hypothetical protein ACI87E_000155, partial [Mariniblastus sp.]
MTSCATENLVIVSFRTVAEEGDTELSRIRVLIPRSFEWMSRNGSARKKPLWVLAFAELNVLLDLKKSLSVWKAARQHCSVLRTASVSHVQARTPVAVCDLLRDQA